MKKILEKYKELPLPVKASLWFLICSILQKGISVITTPIFTRVLSTKDYGSYNVFNSWESIISVFVSLNLSYGVYSQGLIKYEDDRKRFSSSMQGLSLFLLFVWLAVYLLFHKLFNHIFGLNTVYMLLMFILIWTTSVFQFWAGEQRVDFKYKKLVTITLIASICNPILSIILIKKFNDKVLARILGTVIVGVLAYSWMFFKQVISGKSLLVTKYWKHALAFNIPLIPHYLSQTVLNSSDRIMIEKMVGASSSGIYSLAYSISLIMTLFNSALSQTISPWMYKKMKQEKIEDIAPIAYITLIGIGIVNLLLIALAPEAVKFFAPASYYDAIWIIPPVAMSVYFMYAYDLFAKFEFYYEETKLIATATLVSAILNIVLNFIFIKIFGYMAAGYTTLICYIIYAIFHYICMCKVCKKNCKKKPYNTSTIIKITVLFLLGGFIMMALYKLSIIRYLLIIMILIACFCKKSDIISATRRVVSIRKNVR